MGLALPYSVDFPIKKILPTLSFEATVNNARQVINHLPCVVCFFTSFPHMFYAVYGQTTLNFP